MDEQPAAPTVTPPVEATPFTEPAAPATPTAPTASALPGAPDTWPGAFGAYKYSKQAVKINVGTVVVIWLADFVIGLLLEWKLKMLGQAITFLIGGLALVALNLTFISGVRGQRLSMGQALSNALPLWLKMIGLIILLYLSFIISALLLMVPLFFVWPRLVLAPYFLVDKKLGVMEAYKASWAATKGNVGKVYGIVGATILMALLMITIIGIPFSIYFLVMYGAAYAVLYEYINKKAGSPVPVTAAAPDPTATAAVPGMPAAIAPADSIEQAQPVDTVLAAAAKLAQPTTTTIEPTEGPVQPESELPSETAEGTAPPAEPLSQQPPESPGLPSDPPSQPLSPIQ
ncbi:MAG TPA: hypothetical protein VMU97_02160 [Candidatus Dormibacteraeota bacterium]|nr:hypothetical protein [Candidatus Dormibacteraeota bacterium]